ncbi:MAG: PAS domain S-box protein [Methanoregula sp.]|nr:PAS domain S-box protein [Methanoregula sp.]
MISVLFVDDNTDFLALFHPILEKTGEVKLDIAQSTKQAIEKLKMRGYDVIICYEDVPEVNGIEFVPDMDGIGFLKYLRSMGNATPVILFHRTGENKIALGEISNGTEISISRSGDLRTQAADLVTLVKQTTLRRKAEREIKLQNDQLTAILSATPLGIFQMRNDIIEWVNRPLTVLLGTNESLLLGKSIRSLFKNEEEFGQVKRDLQIHRDILGNGLAECELVRVGGGLVACTLQARLLDPLDAMKGGTIVVTDISDRKKMRDALKESEAKYRETMQNSQSIIIRMDLQGVITYFNTFALSFFDYPLSDVIGKNVVGIIVPEKSRGGHDLSMMVNDLGFNADGYAVNLSENMRKNGDRVWIAWINKAIRDAQGHIVEVLCIGHDITDRKQSGEVRISTDTWKDQVIADTDIREEVFDTVFHISTEISIEGREGKAVGTTFLIGDTKNVLTKSRQIMLNAFEGHQPEMRMVTNPDLKENIKEFAQLDGAFVITGDGFIEASGRYITVDSSKVTLPKGMGTRHNSVAAMTSVTKAVGIVVSQSGGGITIFKNGQILKKITL